MAELKDPTTTEKAGSAVGIPAHEPPTAASLKPRKAALWRAIAGMVAALALAFAIVVVEISQQLTERTTLYSQRISTLKQKVRELRHEAAIKEKQLAQARKEIASRHRLQRILLAPDLETIKLLPTVPGDTTSASVVMSRSVRGAVLNATGLAAPPQGNNYDVWWLMGGTSPPVKAAEFNTSESGTATVYFDLPPSGATVAACVVTLEPSKGVTKPSGSMKLKGRLTAHR